jgi:hypothetical protein
MRKRIAIERVDSATALRRTREHGCGIPNNFAIRAAPRRAPDPVSSPIPKERPEKGENSRNFFSLNQVSRWDRLTAV